MKQEQEDQFVESLLDPEFAAHARMLRILRERHPRLYRIASQRQDLLDAIQRLDSDGRLGVKTQGVKTGDRATILRQAERTLLRGEPQALTAFQLLGKTEKQSVAAELGAMIGFGRLGPADVASILAGRSTALFLLASQRRWLLGHIRSFGSKKEKTDPTQPQKKIEGRRKTLQDVVSSQSIGRHLYRILGTRTDMRKTSVVNQRRHHDYKRFSASHLDLKDLDIRDVEFFLRVVLPQYKNLQTLILRPILFQEEVDLTTFDGLKKLRVLVVPWNTTTEAGAARLARLLSRIPWLEELEIHSSMSDHWDALAPGLTALRRLRVLRLDHYRGSPASLEAISTLTNLTLLEISDGDSDIVTVLGNLVNLVTLVLEGCSLELNIDRLAEALPRLQKLEVLRLEGNNIGDSELTILLPGLAALTSLKELDLADNMIQSDGVLRLLQGVPRITELDSLDLSSNWIASNSDGAAALKRLEEDHPNLRIHSYWSSESSQQD